MWQDGITKEISDYMDSLSTLGDEAIEAAKEAIDVAFDEAFENIKDKTPFDTRGLQNSFRRERITDRGENYYGQRAFFEGDAPNGEPYEKIANIVNYGSPARVSKNSVQFGGFTGTFFITNAIRKLRGLNNRINENIDGVLRSKT